MGDYMDVYNTTKTMNAIPLLSVHQMIPPSMFPFAMESVKALPKKKKSLASTTNNSSSATKAAFVGNKNQSIHEIPGYVRSHRAIVSTSLICRRYALKAIQTIT